MKTALFIQQIKDNNVNIQSLYHLSHKEGFSLFKKGWFIHNQLKILKMEEESNLSMNQNITLLANVVYVLHSSTQLVHAHSAIVIINSRTIDF